MTRVCMLMAMVLLATEELKAPSPERCAAGLAPITTVAPRLPPHEHNEFRGDARVSLIIDPTGRVRSPFIVSSQWLPVGRRRWPPVGYDEAILAAVSQWRYAEQQQACALELKMAIEFKD